MKPHLRVLGVPVRFDPAFFLLVGLFGYFAFLQSGDPHGTEKMFLWFPLVTAAVLLHELGHALTARAFGIQSFIVLHALGGTTRLAGSAHARLRGVRRLAIPLAGPAVGLLVGLLAQLAVMFGRLPPESLALEMLQLTVLVTAGWSLLNLIPVLPLDGGHALAALLRMGFGPRGQRMARLSSIALALVVAVVLSMWEPFWAMAAALVAVVNYRALRQEDRLASRVDHGAAAEGYELLARGETARARELAEALLARARTDRERSRALQLAAWGCLLDGRVDAAARWLDELPDSIAPDAYLDGRVRLARGDAAGAVEPLFEALADRGEEEVADALVEAVTRSGKERDVLALFEADERIGPGLFRYVRRALEDAP